MAHTKTPSVPSKPEWPKSRVTEWDRQQQARAGRFDKSVGVKDLAADEATLRLACTSVTKPRGLRGRA